MIFLFSSLFLWIFLLYYGIQHPILNINYNKRGGSGGSSEVSSHTYYYYKVKCPHNSVEPSQPILCYNAYGDLIYTIPAYDTNANYGEGVYSVPGTEQNSTIESVATATYYVFYSSDDLIIDYDNAEFKISKKLIKVPAQTTVKGTFQYYSVITPFKDIASVIDGRWDTQVQTQFFAEPPTGYNYSILDLGSTKQIQAMDIVAGFFKPDDIRKYDVDFNFTLQYSTNGVDYYNISDETHNVHLTGGESHSFEEEDLGVGFEARYLKMVLENVKKLEFGATYITVTSNNRQNLIDQGIITSSTANGASVLFKSGTYVVALTEIAAYDNIILKSSATLIPTTTLTEDIDLDGLSSGEFPSSINVQSTVGFDDSGTAYILNSDGTSDVFYYTGKGASFFYGITGISSNHTEEDYVAQELESDTTLYDYNVLLPKLKERTYKLNKIDDNTLFSESQTNYVAKETLREFIKNHNKLQINVLYCPHINVGDTIEIIDPYNDTSTNYFIESVEDSNGYYSLTVSHYPSV